MTSLKDGMWMMVIGIDVILGSDVNFGIKSSVNFIDDSDPKSLREPSDPNYLVRRIERYPLKRLNEGQSSRERSLRSHDSLPGS